jgi:hypothetical protein
MKEMLSPFARHKGEKKEKENKKKKKNLGIAELHSVA